MKPYPVVRDPRDRMDWPPLATMRTPEDCNRMAELARIFAHMTHPYDAPVVRAYYRIACLYTKQAIRLARTSDHRRQYAAWFRDYYYFFQWA